MHGRLKVKTTAEQQEEKRKERAKKLEIYKLAISKTFAKRKNKEYDDEAIGINHQLLVANPDLTTIWNFQKEILLHLKKLDNSDVNGLFNDELSFTESCLRVNPKSYGAWYHRCWVLDTMPTPNWEKELALCDRYLGLDERNFHCWDYRRFIVKRANVSPEDELTFTMKLINNNFSNYSAWHYRSKLLPLVYPDPNGQLFIREDIRLQELELVQNAAFTDPNDQSGWFYHRWLLGRDKPTLIEEPLKLLCLYINRQNSFIVVTFKKPINLKSNRYCLEVKIDEKCVAESWSSIRVNDIASTVWLMHIPSSLFHLEKNQNVTTLASGFCEEIESLNVVLKSEEVEGWTFSFPDYSKHFCTELSEPESALLEGELESCLQLKELEPDNKWTRLTSIFLMRVINPDKYEKEILNEIRTIETDAIDINRKNYYNDMYSKFLLENILKRIEFGNAHNTREVQAQRVINITNQGLTAIYNFDLLILVTKLDLSDNKLRSLRPLHCLVCLKELIAKHNYIDSCNGLEHLPALENVILDNNYIATTKSLSPLKLCPKLGFLSLNSNPLIDTKGDELCQWISENLKISMK